MVQPDPKSRAVTVRSFLLELQRKKPDELFYLSELVDMVCAQHSWSFGEESRRRTLAMEVSAAAGEIEYDLIPRNDKDKIILVIEKSIAAKEPALTAREIAARVEKYDRKPRAQAASKDLLSRAYKIAKRMDYDVKTGIKVYKPNSPYAITHRILIAAKDSVTPPMTSQEVVRQVAVQAGRRLTKREKKSLIGSIHYIAAKIGYDIDEHDGYSKEIRAVLAGAPRTKMRGMNVDEVAEEVCVRMNIAVSDVGDYLYQRIYAIAKKQRFFLATANAHIETKAIRRVIRKSLLDKEEPLTSLEIARRAAWSLRINPIGKRHKLFIKKVRDIADREDYEFASRIEKRNSRDFLLPPTPRDKLAHAVETAYFAGREVSDEQAEKIVGTNYVHGVERMREKIEIKLLKEHAPRSMLILSRLGKNNLDKYSKRERMFLETLMDAILPRDFDATQITPAELKLEGYAGVDMHKFDEWHLARAARPDEHKEVVRHVKLAGRCLFYHACRNTGHFMEWYVVRKEERSKAHRHAKPA